MEKIISNKAASFVSMELARYALERADLRASSILTAIATTLGVTRAWDKTKTRVCHKPHPLFFCFYLKAGHEGSKSLRVIIIFKPQKIPVISGHYDFQTGVSVAESLKRSSADGISSSSNHFFNLS